MTPLEQTAAALHGAYGTQALPGPPGEWPTLVKLVIGHKLTPHKLDTAWSELLANGHLQSAADTLRHRDRDIALFLGEAGLPEKLAAPLRALAKWWDRHADKATGLISPTEAEYGRFGGIESLRAELRQGPHLSLELADRILLFALGLPAYPLDRGSIRIVCRHGWLGLEADYEEWQELFIRGQRDSNLDLAQLSSSMRRLGHERCAGRPDCNGCPLEGLLPTGGPYEVQD